MQSNIYVYNNFLELLVLIKILFKSKIRPGNIKNVSYEANMFDNLINLDLNDNENIIDEYIKFFGKFNFKIIYYVYLSNYDNKELVIYYYLLNYFKYKNNLPKMLNLNCVSMALKISKKVSNENHRFKGFVRFRELENKVLYAEINPDNDILYILSMHFKNRLKNYNWIIKDMNRNMLSIYDKKEIYLIEDKNFKFVNTNCSNDEENFENLWQIFYKTIGIESRKNDRCRMNFMPKKYWKYILEVRNEV